IESLIGRGQKSKGEFQLTDCLRNMLHKGAKIAAGRVHRWMDCGNKDAILDTNRYLLSERPEDIVNASELSSNRSVVVPPCYIGKGVTLEDCVVGPHVSLGDGVRVVRSVVRNSVVRDAARIENAVLDGALIGSHASVALSAVSPDLGDYSRM
ncbi:MAG: nucleotidyltransferase, partial [Bacteroidia bacterium]|nr:nucleotidyltransferase [Bacteroidia bacterium]MDW8334076.1 nucleotidyltransferase [Bacteroidia bacterium]